jgi:hypothetical protein
LLPGLADLGVLSITGLSEAGYSGELKACFAFQLVARFRDKF